jgi:hypothetical protein
LIHTFNSPKNGMSQIYQTKYFFKDLKNKWNIERLSNIAGYILLDHFKIL